MHRGDGLYGFLMPKDMKVYQMRYEVFPSHYLVRFYLKFSCRSVFGEVVLCKT